MVHIYLSPAGAVRPPPSYQNHTARARGMLRLTGISIKNFQSRVLTHVGAFGRGCCTPSQANEVNNVRFVLGAAPVPRAARSRTRAGAARGTTRRRVAGCEPGMSVRANPRSWWWWWWWCLEYCVHLPLSDSLSIGGNQRCESRRGAGDEEPLVHVNIGRV